MARYRKKPIVVEAVQVTDWWNQQHPAICRKWPRECGADYNIPHVHTLEGSLAINDGDWIVCGVEGEYYPVRPSIFAATYEPVEDDSSITASGPTPKANTEA